MGNNKGNLASPINNWLFDGMVGSTGSFACDLENAGVVSTR